MWYNFIGEEGLDLWVNTAHIVTASRGAGNRLVLELIDGRKLITGEDYDAFPPREVNRPDEKGSQI